MIPRFSNPHLLPQAAEIVSRATVLNNDEYEPVDIEVKRLAELNRMVEQRLMNYSTLLVERPEEQKKVELPEISSPDRNARQSNSRCAFQFGHEIFPTQLSGLYRRRYLRVSFRWNSSHRQK